jgi:membrane protease YdiL (CAAX protease family)
MEYSSLLAKLSEITQYYSQYVMNKEHKNILKILVSFLMLFVLYHSAEYMILFKKSISGFLIFQFLFFLSAWLLGNWNQKNGFDFWGLSFSKFRIKYLLIGLFLGVVLYAIPYIFSLFFEIEFITKAPLWTDILKAGVPFSFGLIFSSFSEDVLTRSTVFRLYNNKISSSLIIIISSLIYVLNHIYRLNAGIETFVYLFLLGVVLTIPLIITGNLWITGIMHWSGNTFFYISHEIILIKHNPIYINPNLIFIFWILILIPIVWYLISKFKSKLV